jgi:TolB protein
LRSTLVITSNRDNLSLQPTAGAEIYLMNPDATDVRRLTYNTSEDIFPVLSPVGTRIVFDSLRRHPATDPASPPDLFLMNADGKGQRFLTQGSSATWSPDGQRIAFHASASGSGTPINTTPGAATYDSDIFVANVNDLLDHGPGYRTNITNSPKSIDSDADWSPDGKMIVFTIQPVSDVNPRRPSGPPKLHVMNADGTGLRQLPDIGGSEVAPDWSPDGNRIAFMCGPQPPAAPSHERGRLAPDPADRYRTRRQKRLRELGPTTRDVALGRRPKGVMLEGDGQTGAHACRRG